MRLFVSIPLPPAQRDHLRRAVVGGRTTDPLRWHLTLVFLGDRDDDLSLIEALSSVDHGALSLQLRGNGAFPGASWAGVAGDVDALRALQAEVARATGAPPETYRPHVTVGRRGHAMPPGDYEGPPWQVESFDLVESFFTEHQVLASFPLR